jgi:hypothetical protein
MRSSANVLLSVIVLAVLTTFADACVLNGPRYQLASDTVRWSLELTDGETCIRGVRFNNVVVNKLMVVSLPHSGHITLRGTGFSYEAARDFQGRDFFSLMVSGATNKVPGSSTIEVEVSVTSAMAGSSASSAPQPSPVNDLCGSSNNVPVSSAPTTNLCSTGTASVLSGSGPWRWSCIGSDGGTIAQCSASLKTAYLVQKPGPSADLFANPYYTCVKNYYISISGSDSNNGSSDSPWRTLQHANSVPRAAGDCINVAPGAYNGVVISQGGNAAASTGYVVYRCQTLDGCTINGNAGPNRNASVFFSASGISASAAPANGNYVQFDGFVMRGQANRAGSAYEIGFVDYNYTNGKEIAHHHVWLLNSIIFGFGQAGVSVGSTDYLYAIHNTAYDNAFRQCDAQGSGIAINIAHDIPGYTPTADDQTPFSGFGFPTWELGDGTFFHVVFAYNVTYNNHLSGCSKGTVTDSNGIIFDTNAGPDGNSTDYHNPMLAYGNVSYNNGGGGVLITRSFNVTIANNTAFNNYIDPDEFGGAGSLTDNNGGNIDNGKTYSNYFYNNIAVNCTSAFPASSVANGGNNAIFLAPTAGDDPAQGNITYMVTSNPACGAEVQLYNRQTYDKTQNMVATNAQWVNVPFSSPGTESTPPAGTNFALSPGSPAIGYGTVKSWMPPSSVDAGACPSSLATCP